MRVRLKFEKKGRLKYIGHLDLLNIFNRALKSAKLPVLYSNGFNPHMLVVFAAPLPLGITSTCEYVDIDFADDFDTGKVIPAINTRFPDGLTVKNIYVLNPPYKRAPSIVCSAGYNIGIITKPHLISAFLSQSTIEVMKKTKKNTALCDIKPDIFSVAITESGIKAVLSCGSVKNLKPQLFARTFLTFVNEHCCVTENAYVNPQIERYEIFGSASSCNEAALPLSNIL